jgi:UDP-N-acetylglucosamine acyltransferase
LSRIDSSAIVDPGAIIGKNVEIGPFSIIENNVKIGDDTKIADNVLIKEGTTIGKENKICHCTLIGGDPQDLSYKGWKSGVEIGDNNTLREFVTIHKASKKNKLTKIGNNCFLMAYVHIAHDCSVGNNVIIANATQMGGFVTVEDNAFLSALIPIHQFSKVGGFSIVGGGYRIDKDVIPYALAGGEPLRLYGLNIVGLRRNNFKKETINILKKAFDIIQDKGFNTTQVVEKIKKTLPKIPEIDNILRFIKESKRGIVRG